MGYFWKSRLLPNDIANQADMSKLNIESAFTNIARFENSDKIELALRLEDGAITLAIDDTSPHSGYAGSEERDTDSDMQARFAEAQERTTLSGGSFTLAHSKAGGVTLRASWTA